ncbi:MAG: VanZ family protein [bacterium]|nr:VanZ family protein [bacterium]
MKSILIKCIVWVSVVFCMALIFHLSHEPAEKSNETSANVISTTLKTISPRYNRMTADEQESLVNTLQSSVRTFSHFSLFCMLGFTLSLALSLHALKTPLRIFITLSGCLLYAVLDEFHQYFIPGRAQQIVDVLVDFTGSITGMLLVFVLFVIIRSVSAKKKRTA